MTKEAIVQRLFLSHDGDSVSAITPEEMAELLRYTVQHGAIGPEELVESAARSAYVIVRRPALKEGPEKPVLVLAGNGYAGAAALALARHLANHDVPVDFLHAPGTPTDAGIRQLGACRLSHCTELQRLPQKLSAYSLVIDALSDILPGTMSEAVLAIVRELCAGGAGNAEDRRSRLYKLISFETPAGVDAGTGVAAATSIWADTSIAFGLPKTGMVAPQCGSVTVADIGIPGEVYRRQATIAYPCNFRDGFVLPLRSMGDVGY